MRLEIIATARLSAEDAGALRALNAAVYPPTPRADKATSRQEWAAPQWSVMIRDAQRQLVSHVGVLTRLGLCDGKELLIGGIGGVQTHPAQRRKGFAGAGIVRAIEFLQEELAVEMLLLFCGPSMLRYYQRFGFCSFAGDTFVRREGAQILFPRSEVMVKPALKAVPGCAQLDLCGLPW